MADCTMARRYLHLAAESAAEVKRLVSPGGSSGPEINRLQCNYLSVKVAEAVKEAETQIIKNESEECETKKGELVLKTLCRVAQDVERFVSFCCREHWRHPALLLGDPREQVSRVASELQLSIQLLQITTSTSSGAVEHQITLTPEICQSMRELSEAEVAVIKENARLDYQNLLKILDDEYGSSSRGRNRADFITVHINTSSTDSSSAPTPSKVDADRKLLKLESIGRGAFAKVFKTKWMDEPYARKVFPPTHTEAFKNEASILAGLSHPNILPIVCVGVTTTDCSSFLLTELMDGDLHTLMEVRMERVMNHGEDGDQTLPFDLTEAVNLMLQIAEGVRYLHEKPDAILHGNLRAANILIKQVKPLRQFPDQEHFQAKVASFGLSHELKRKNVTYNTRTYRADSVRWMAPELVSWLDQNHHVNLQVNSQDVHRNFPLQADVYSFGMVCFEILTGGIPFSELSRSDLQGKILEGLKPEIPKWCPPGLTAMIEKCWSVSPNERPSFQEICMELTRFKCELMIENKVDLPAHSSNDSSSSKPGGVKSELEDNESLLNKLEEIKKSADTKEEREIADHLIERYKINRRSPCEVDSADLKTGCRLGKGESGIIYETTWLGFSFARKDFPGTNPHFEQEASTLIDLRHLNIVRTYCWALDRRSCSLVMELMADDLHTLVQKRKGTNRKIKTSSTSTNSSNSTVNVEEKEYQKVDLQTFLEKGKMMPHKQAIIPFDTSEAIDIMFQVATGMKYLHGKGVAHGDLKPKNILVEFHPGGLDHMVVKVCDFGLTKTKTLSSLSSTVQTQHVGTCRWKAPELIEAVKNEESCEFLMDTFLMTGHLPECFIQSKLAKADVYSFALTCAEILTGEVPFSKSEFHNFHDFYESIKAGVRPDLPATCPPELENLCQRCWDTNPACRPTFNEICDELEKFQQDVKGGNVSTVQDETEEQQETMNLLLKELEVPDHNSSSVVCSFWLKKVVLDTDSGVLRCLSFLRPITLNMEGGRYHVPKSRVSRPRPNMKGVSCHMSEHDKEKSKT